MHITWVSLLALAGVVPAYQLPAGLNQIYETHKSSGCKNVLRGGFSDGSSGNDVSYCGDIQGAIFLHTNSNSGAYADMDVDCDGADNGAGACSNDPSGQGETAFKDEVSQYGISDLNANIHPYVVFGNDGSSPSFDPKKYGMQPLSVMAVVCNGQLHYGIWGDTNGGISTGEASISLAKLCFPNDNITGDNGHGEKDVLYIGFIGKDAVPGNEADWHAKDSNAFEKSIKSLGDRLVAKLTGTAARAFSTPVPSSTSVPAWSTVPRPTPSGSSVVSSSSFTPISSTPAPSRTPFHFRPKHGWRPGSGRPTHA